jgi:hypothetical protein
LAGFPTSGKREWVPFLPDWSLPAVNRQLAEEWPELLDKFGEMLITNDRSLIPLLFTYFDFTFSLSIELEESRRSGKCFGLLHHRTNNQGNKHATWTSRQGKKG